MRADTLAAEVEMRFLRPSPPRVSNAVAGDLGQLLVLYERAWGEPADPLSEEERERARPAAEDIAAWFRGGLEVFRLTHDQRLMGAVRCSFPSGSCHIDNLVVAPDLRNRGFGRALIEHCLARGRRAALPRTWAQVDARLKVAGRLLLSAGFQETGRHQTSDRRTLILFEKRN